MSTQVLERAFEKMGARVQFGPPRQSFRTLREIRSGVTSVSPMLTLDVSHDKDGEYFFIRWPEAVGLEVLDVQPKDRHLLLLARDGREKARYLMGHDERHWFVAGVSKAVSTVRDAKEALKPSAVVSAERGLKAKHREKRHNLARKRQGEWFFVPEPSLIVAPSDILHKEPLRRSNASKPHVCDELFRSGGETVYVCRKYPVGLTQKQYDELTEKERREQISWQRMVRNPSAWARGRVRHSDHATLKLDGWHRVYGNMEFFSGNVVFLD